MQVDALPIAGALLLTAPEHADARGYFKETYAAARYRDAGIPDAFVQDNLSLSHCGVLRGLHGDRRPMAKLVGVLEGCAYDAIVDVRPDSPTRGQWYGVVLDGDANRQLYVPPGCLHGFLALSDRVLFGYKQSAPYDPACEIGVRFDDPDIAVAWPLRDRTPHLSARDAANPTARELGLLRP